MTLDALLSRLHGVRRTRRGYAAQCPAHPDKSPSLAVAVGERGLLVKCWAGCTVEEICAALNLHLADLFFDAPVHRGHRPAPKPIPVDRVNQAFQFDLAALDRRLRAEHVLEVAQALNISTFDDSDLDRALGHVAQAYADRERADLLEHVADSLRQRDYAERTNRERETCAA